MQRFRSLYWFLCALCMLLLASPVWAGYVNNGDGTVTDTTTGLMWQQETPDNTMTWAQALSYCENLSWAGHSDWRLPTRNELRTLVDYSKYGPAINTTFFPDTVASFYWSSTTNAGDTYGAWVVYFYDGYGNDSIYFKSYGYYVRAVRGGQSGVLGDLVISPSSATYPSIFIGDTSTKSFTVSNRMQTSVRIDSAAISGADASDFSLGDNCSGSDLASNSNCIITANFTPRSCGTKSATLTVATSQGNLAAALTGSACGSGTASLNGTVRDAATLIPLSGAVVSVGTNGPYTTDTDGKYQASGIASGMYEMRVSKSGYGTFIGSITIDPLQTALKNVKLSPSTVTGFRVTNITSKYSNGSLYYFLPGISFDVNFTAEVDWGEKSPGKVRFITSKGYYDVPTSGNTATKTINVGTECSSCSTLEVIAIAANGSQSAAKKADFIVTNPLPVDPELPVLTSNLAIEYSDSSFRYLNKSTLSKNLLDQTMGDYKNTPILKESATALSYVPEFDFEFSGQEGKAAYTLTLFKNCSEYKPILEKYYTKRKNEHGLKDIYKYTEHWLQNGSVDRRHFPAAKIASFEINLFPVLQGEYSFNAARCSVSSSGWSSMEGYLGFAGEAEWGVVYQSFLPPPLPPIPYYFKPAIGLGFDAMLNLNDSLDLKPSGDLSTSPYISGTIGVGVNDVVGLEGTGKGGVELAWQFPVSTGQNAITDCNAFLSITGKAYFLMFTKDFPTQRWEESCFGENSSGNGSTRFIAPDQQSDGTLTLIPRDYLKFPNALAFRNKPFLKEKRFATAEQVYSVFSSPIVTSTFPVSAAYLSSAGSHVNLIWLTDNVNRSSINRTMAVHSVFDGISWSTPAPIADNGTADFNPNSLTITDGGIISAWEDVNTVLADTTTLEDMTAQLEISAAVYDPTTRTWGAAVRLTDNQILDRTPKLAGKDISNILLTWIANDQNDISGGATHPNQLMYAFYNGSSWSTPMTAAVIPNSIKRYNVVYDGTTANIVLSLDTDDNPSTITDLELYRLVYSNGAWGTLTRLTNDTLIDDNPQLSLDSGNNVVMNWVKDKELSGVVNFDFTKRTVIRAEDAYNSSLADFRQAATTDGRVAVIYTDISENNTCDLFGVFFDPIFKTWGLSKQLTDDPETEQWPSIAFMGTDTIIGIYNRKLLIDQNGTPTEGEPTDLYMVKHVLADDLAVEDGSLTADISNAAPGTTVTLSAKVQNLGDNTAQNIKVNFYLGNPSSGGTLIGMVVITTPLKPGDSVIVSLPWTIPEGTAPVSIYVVVDPDAGIDILNRTNNTTSTTLGLPDLKIQNFTAEKLGSDNFSLVVSVANIGGTTCGASNVKLHLGSNTGTVIATIGLQSLARFASVDLSYEWKTTALAQSDIVLVAVADEGNIITESNKSNNTSQLTIKGDPVLSVAPTVSYPAKEAGTTTFGVSNTGTGTMAWTAAVTSGSSWLSISSGTSGTNTGTITCAYTANTSGAARSGTIRVTAENAAGSPLDVTVTQSAATITPVISGSVKTGTGSGISGVAIVFSNSGGTATTDASGNYSVTVPNNYSGTATPYKSGYTFTPTSRTYANVTANQTGQNFTGAAVTASRQQFWGIWSDGVYAWNKTTGKWTKMASTSNAMMIAAGKIDSDSIDDLIGVWTSGLYVKLSSSGQWLKLSTTLPTWIAAGDLNNDGRDDVIASWKNDAVYYRDSATGKWIKLSSAVRQLAAGNIGGTRDDLAGVWSDGLWVRFSATAAWQKIDAAIPGWIAAGDISGDKQADIVGSYSTGTWYRNSATKTWTKITTPAEQITVGDLDGDGRDDLIGIWSNGVYVRYGATNQWQLITSSKPKWITTGKIADALQSADALNDPMESPEGNDMIDLSQEGPDGMAADRHFLDGEGPMPAE